MEPGTASAIAGSARRSTTPLGRCHSRSSTRGSVMPAGRLTHLRINRIRRGPMPVSDCSEAKRGVSSMGRMGVRGLDIRWAGAGKRRAALVENPRHPPFARWKTGAISTSRPRRAWRSVCAASSLARGLSKRAVHHDARRSGDAAPARSLSRVASRHQGDGHHSRPLCRGAAARHAGCRAGRLRAISGIARSHADAVVLARCNVRGRRGVCRVDRRAARASRIGAAARPKVLESQ